MMQEWADKLDEWVDIDKKFHINKQWKLHNIVHFHFTVKREALTLIKSASTKTAYFILKFRGIFSYIANEFYWHFINFLETLCIHKMCRIPFNDNESILNYEHHSFWHLKVSFCIFKPCFKIISPRDITLQPLFKNTNSII